MIECSIHSTKGSEERTRKKVPQFCVFPKADKVFSLLVKDLQAFELVVFVFSMLIFFFAFLLRLFLDLLPFPSRACMRADAKILSPMIFI